MQQWEYLLWELDESHGRSNVEWISGQFALQDPPMPLISALAEVGAQGWELVSAYSSANDCATYLFKRPKK
jgi:hypothetical protein